MKPLSYVLAMAAVVLGLLSPLGAYPPFQTGYWNLVDSSFIAVLGSGILASAWVVSIAAQGRFEHLRVAPSTGFLLLLAFIGGVAALNSTFPLAALVGTYQSGYGPVLHLVTALLVVVASELMNDDCAQRTIGLTATVIASILSATLAYTLLTGDTIILPSSDSYGLIGFFMLFLPRAKWRNENVQRLLFWALRISAVLLILLSVNVSLILLLVAGGASWLLLNKTEMLRSKLRHLTPGVVMIGVIILAALPLSLFLSNAVDGFGMSLHTRAVIADIMTAAFHHSSGMDWTIGHGWGRIQDAFYQYLHWSKLPLYSLEWDFLWRDVFHSHNFVIETLYSVGIIGLCCMLAFVVSIYVGAPEHSKIAALAFIAGYVLHSSVWYDLSFHLPYLALVLASLNTGGQAAENTSRKHGNVAVPWIVASASAAIAVGLMVLLVNYEQFSQKVFTLKPDKHSLENNAFSTAAFPYDPRETDFARAMLYRDVFREIEPRTELHNDEGLAVLTDIIEDVERRMEHTRSPELLLIGIELLSNVSLLPQWEWASPVLVDREGLWGALALKSLEIAPYRSDLLIPYLTHLLSIGQFEKLVSLVRIIEEKNHDDAVGLYYFGAVLTQDPDLNTKQKGMQVIAQAMDCGLEMYIEIPDWLADVVQPFRGQYLGCTN